VTLTVATYNIRVGGSGRVEELAAVLRPVGADAVALLEASAPGASAALAARLEMELVIGESAGPLGMHVAWLTRAPPRRAQNHPLPALSKTLLEVELEWASEPLRLFATHLASRHEVAQYPRDGEIAAILDVLARAGARQLLVGDLNALHPNDPIGRPPPGVVPFGEAAPGAARRMLPLFLDAGYVDCFRALNPLDPGYTYTSAHPWLRLDYVLVPARVAGRVTSCKVVASGATASASDHLPVVAVLD
jgi:endonuclease/exonuclease/phosphatase family metal-dependent hydrolase